MRHHLRLCLLLLLIVVGSAPVDATGDQSSPSHILSTERFEFHSNFWINLHHFLFQQAKRPDEQPMPGGRRLSREEFQQIDGAIDWYREHLAEHSLLMNERLYAVKRALITFGPDELTEHPALTGDHRVQLLAAAPVYRRHYWPRHDLQNHEVLFWHLQRIRTMEAPVLERIAELAQQDWPDGIIRVDLTWDANWAGAYCTTNPIHVVLTSRIGGPDNSWPPGGWMELLFHEPSHAIIDPQDSTVGKLLVEQAKARGLDSTGQLWHAVLFLFSGTAVREALERDGLDHRILMESEGIFRRDQPRVNEGMEPYMAGETSLDDALAGVVAQLERR